jgi:hypothetical protein
MCRTGTAAELCAPPSVLQGSSCLAVSAHPRTAPFIVLQAALALTTELDPSVPTIGFLITDAPPHLGTDAPSPTNTHELRYLCNRGLTDRDAADFFKCFQATALSHFGSNLILNCVVDNSGVNTNCLSAEQLLYGSLAQQTGGMLMEPDSSRDPRLLARGLTAVVTKLLACMPGVLLPAGSQRSQQRQQQQYGMRYPP